MLLSLCTELASVILLLLLIQPSRAIVLCDEGCLNVENASSLEICTKDESREPLYVMGLFPCNVPDFRARGLTVSGQMAVRAVRRNTSILQDYRLELSFSNTMVSEVS